MTRQMSPVLYYASFSAASTTQQQMTVDFGTFTVGGQSLGTPTWYLPAL